MKLPKFTLQQAEDAFDEWGFNCGPSAIATICDLSIEELRPHLFSFESKKYTNPTLMRQILDDLRILHRVHRGEYGWPKWGLARIQWEGPWTRPGVPMAARYRYTHWVGVDAHNNKDVGIWDINCLHNGSGWVSLKDWSEITVPYLLKYSYPKATGGWHLTHSIEIILPLCNKVGVAPSQEKTREWYEENDPQALVDSINAANCCNPAITQEVFAFAPTARPPVPGPPATGLSRRGGERPAHD